LALSGVLIAQTYPLVTIEEIQFQSDSSLLANGDLISPLYGDTVKFRGVVMVAPVVNAATDRRRIIAAGARWTTYIQDVDGNVYDDFDGIFILQEDTTGANQGTFFDLVDTAQVVEFTGVVSEFSTTTEFFLLLNPVTPVQIIDQLPKRPDPIELTVNDFDNGGSLNILAERYEGEYVVVRNFITSDRNLSSGTFTINDGLGNKMIMYDQSGYFTLRAHRLTGLTTYQPPQDGSFISYIRGTINTRTDGYYIVPMYPGDIGPVTSSPPIISSIRRNSAEVASNQAVEISAKLIDLDGTVQEGRVYYRVDGGQRIMLPMTFSPSDTLYKATIPGVNSDSSLVDFYLWAKDNDDLQSINPVDTLTDNYFYLVLDRPVTIKDVQYSPFGGGFSGYTNYVVTIHGIITSDSSDVKGYGSSSFARNYVQFGEGPWSGMQISFGAPLGSNLYGLLRRGDDVTMTGTIQESFGVTRINNVTGYNINSSGNSIPAPYIITTGEIGTLGDGEVPKEKWESVLVAYQNAEITNINADGGSNFGELFVSDGTGDTRVELEDGSNSYHNGSGEPGTILIQQNATFDELIGIMYYSFSNYKLVPRKDDDFVNYTGVIDENTIPTEYSLEQNYPNPFNPSTTIQYSLPEAGTVNINIYNLLGENVRTIINNSTQAAGSYKAVFNASSLPSGIYFYRLEVNDFVQVKKMILMK
jgi:predicted extracellular nuclease